MIETGKQSVLFYRDFHGLTGGHLKVWHYFNHVKASTNYAPRVHFTENSVRDRTNPWWQCDHSEIAESWQPSDADVVFIGGLDWNAMPTELLQSNKVPIINIVQGLSHADPQDPKFAFLQHKAIRICVNPLIEDALLATGQLNGPLIHIPMGLELSDLPESQPQRHDVVIAAMKAPELGAKIAARLEGAGRHIKLLAAPLAREQYLREIAASRVAVLLPLRLEGFFLPMLEAMAMRRITVSPDCVANRAYCVPGKNGFLPEYTADAIVTAAESALNLSKQESLAIAEQAERTAFNYRMERERDAFLDVLSRVDELWRGEHNV